MNADGFSVDANRLTGQAGQFDGLVARLGSIHRDLTDALSSAGSCWGTDAVGQSFASVHVGPADAAVERLAALPEQLGSVGGRLSDTATTYRDADTSGVDSLRATER